MEALKPEGTIHRITSPEILKFQGGTFYIWVIHADKIPPHLGFSSGAKFYSLKANGKDDGVGIESIIRVLERKKIATLFYRISPDAVRMRPEIAFRQVDKTIPGKITCLNPLKSIFDNTTATWIKDLLIDLEEKNAVTNVYGWQIEDDFRQISDYSPEDIHRRLTALINV